MSEVFEDKKGTHVWIDQTICELHRQIYDLLVVELYESNRELFDKIVPILEKAYICGTKMTKKLLEYKCSLPDWEQHYSKQEVERLRKLRIELTEKLKDESLATR